MICLDQLRDLSLGPMTLFQRPICVSIRLHWLYPVAVCQAMHPLLRIWAIWRSRTGRITRRLQADHCALWRRYDHIQGLPIPLPQQISCGRSIVGAVSQKARDRGIQLIQEAG